MSLLRRVNRQRGSRVFSNIDMTSLMDLTFLLLITFIVTMPALEQSISVRLPQGKADELPQKKVNTISLDVEGKTYFNNAEITLDDLERTLGNLAAEDPETAILVRGDERIEYGKIAAILKILYKVKITRMALVTQAE
jgi:biopolymer transport protein ExbD